MKEKDSMKNTFVVLGFSRSGTSMVTSLLEKCGVYLGTADELREASSRNKLGYFENKLVNKVNNDLISQMAVESERDLFSSTYSGTYKNLQLNANGFLNKFSRRKTVQTLKQFIEKMNPHDVWGFKGHVATFRLWKKYLPKHKIIVVFRHPLSVAFSHMKSSQETRPFSRTIRDWTDINKELLYDITVNDSLVIKYEDILSGKGEVFKKLVQFTGGGSVEELKSCVNQNLNNSGVETDKVKDIYPLSEDTKSVLEALEKLSQR